MRKIPTVFQRDPEDRRRLLPKVTPGCEWVLAGEGVPTRKYNGTCCMFDGEQWWARREVKPGRPAPAVFRAEETHETTGRTVGWVPMADSPFARWHAEAVDALRPLRTVFPEGTYELCGPRINGNPEGYARHELVLHARAERLHDFEGGPPPSFGWVREWLTRWVIGSEVEGIVWHHPDGRMAKVKTRDFRDERKAISDPSSTGPGSSTEPRAEGPLNRGGER